MPKVSDAARVTTKDNTVWRTCTGCSRLKPLPDQADRCDSCATEKPPAATGSGWDIAYDFAELVGGIQAWAEEITDVTDAERLDHIRHLLKTLHPLRKDKGVK
ncbi:hypothetical protein [Actinoplanes sp. DH11]|uniref:hypothetical protein n=1 Tax=Actinoplanes sp. DH11 TaxID=2857011 RepID=UPI001E5F1C0C|nr:hypothetical protein [Actinoplanes sp. DH11]